MKFDTSTSTALPSSATTPRPSSGALEPMPGEVETQNPVNPMHSTMTAAHASPRCGAKTRAGTPCRSPSVKDRPRCRMHGARAGAPTGKANGRFRTGLWTQELRDARRLVRQVLATVGPFDDG